jgi:hypothetical protein
MSEAKALIDSFERRAEPRRNRRQLFRNAGGLGLGRPIQHPRRTTEPPV